MYKFYTKKGYAVGSEIRDMNALLSRRDIFVHKWGCSECPTIVWWVMSNSATSVGNDQFTWCIKVHLLDRQKNSLYFNVFCMGLKWACRVNVKTYLVKIHYIVRHVYILLNSNCYLTVVNSLLLCVMHIHSLISIQKICTNLFGISVHGRQWWRIGVLKNLWVLFLTGWKCHLW